jgi:hypothetical protein
MSGIFTFPGNLGVIFTRFLKIWMGSIFVYKLSENLEVLCFTLTGNLGAWMRGHQVDDRSRYHTRYSIDYTEFYIYLFIIARCVRVCVT